MRPFRYALMLALPYALLASVWIAWSSGTAARQSGTVSELAQYELLKGLGFVAVTSVLTLGLAWVLFRHLQRTATEAAAHRAAFLAAERRSFTGLFAASVAHDVGNVLTVLGFGVAELQAQGVDPELTGQMAEAVERGNELVQRLRQADQLGVFDERVEVDLVEQGSEIVGQARMHRKARRRDLELVSDEPVTARVYPGLVVQLVLNLLFNALEATPSGGRIELRIAGQGDEVVFEVHDDGPGVTEEQRDRLFEPFVSSKSEGSGLGLVSVRLCAEAHGGTVVVDRSPLGGACFRVRLPRDPPRDEDRPENSVAA